MPSFDDPVGESMSDVVSPESRQSTPEIIPQVRKAAPIEKKANEPQVPVIPIEQYIALGCISFVDPSTDTAKEPLSESDWVEFEDHLPELLNEQIPWKALVTLWRAFWIRIFTSVARDDKQTRIWRISVLPDDTARTSVDRNGQSLRKSLSRVLQVVDTSPELWSGYVDLSRGASDDNSQTFQQSMTTDLSSLFYIFNTLPSPNPDPSLARDRYARIAMQELLESTLPVRGLAATLYPYQRRYSLHSY